MVIYGAIVYSRAICSTAATRRYRLAIHRALGRLLADTVWLISFHDLINHSISAQRRISIVLKASDWHKRRPVMTPATDINMRRTDLGVLVKYLLRSILLRLILMIRLAFKLQRFESHDGGNHFNGSFLLFFARGGTILAQFHCCLFSFHGSAGIIRALLITFSYDLDLKGQGNQYNSH